MNLRTKLLGGFGIMAALAVALAVIGLVSTMKLDGITTEMSNLQEEQNSLSNVLNKHYVWRQGLTEFVLTEKTFTGSRDPNTCALGAWLNSEYARNMKDPELLRLLRELSVPHRVIHNEANTIVELMQSGNQQDAALHLENLIFPKTDEVIAYLTEMQSYYVELVHNKDLESMRFTNIMMAVYIVFVVVSVVAFILLALYFSDSIVKPIIIMANYMKKASSTGDLSMTQIEMKQIDLLMKRKDEIAELSNGAAAFIGVITSLIDDLNKTARMISVDGDIEAKIDGSKYVGSYREVVESINDVVGGVINDIINFFGAINGLGNGDFTVDLEILPGKKIIMNETLDNFKKIIQSVNDDIISLVNGALNGQLSSRADVSAYRGDWATLVGGLNDLMDAVSAPLVRIREIMNDISHGEFDQQMEGAYKGDFLTIKNSVNETVVNIASYINEISSVLAALAEDDLNQDIRREYVGRFSDIKNAMLNIIDKYNTVISSISSASEQVSSGAKLISESSVNLATGATEQASSIEELNATIQTINENTTRNAESAKEADRLSVELKDYAQRGNEDMDHMLDSMNGIKESSNRISKIIKVIEDIAFQTNLLALNAAVEAARAGVHGKGFSVVADEVRSLASKTQVSAKETAELIEEAIKRVNEGMDVAGKTDKALKGIVSEASSVAAIITDISKASDDQALAIGQVMSGITQITDVVQSNSASAEESASASQELASQSDVLRSMTSVFKLKRN